MSKGAIVFAEDDPSNRQLIATLLSAAGYTPVAVKDGISCLNALTRVTPKAVLLDINMPGLNGLATLEAIRGSIHWQELPVIFVTARPDQQVLEHAKRYGAVHIIAKPFRPDEFVQRLERCLVLARSQPRKPVPEGPAVPWRDVE
ncbi:MAG TPA: response regulator [Azospirillaceae bacterium]|nr:response regulator [Azospirillaceae bacterium]